MTQQPLLTVLPAGACSAYGRAQEGPSPNCGSVCFGGSGPNYIVRKLSTLKITVKHIYGKH